MIHLFVSLLHHEPCPIVRRALLKDLSIRTPLLKLLLCYARDLVVALVFFQQLGKTEKYPQSSVAIHARLLL